LAAFALIVVAMLAVGCWFAWQDPEASLPPLAKGMSASSWTEGDRLFKQRIARTYPVGSPAALLSANLAAQGFTIKRRGDWRFAELRRFVGWRDKVWRVEWEVDEGRLGEVSAFYRPEWPLRVSDLDDRRRCRFTSPIAGSNSIACSTASS
jgi:hypothetical protein